MATDALLAGTQGKRHYSLALYYCKHTPAFGFANES